MANSSTALVTHYLLAIKPICSRRSVLQNKRGTSVLYIYVAPLTCASKSMWPQTPSFPSLESREDVMWSYWSLLATR